MSTIKTHDHGPIAGCVQDCYCWSCQSNRQDLRYIAYPPGKPPTDEQRSIWRQMLADPNGNRSHFCPHGKIIFCETCNPDHVKCPGCGRMTLPEHMATDLGINDERCLSCWEQDPEGGER